MQSFMVLICSDVTGRVSGGVCSAVSNVQAPDSEAALDRAAEILSADIDVTGTQPGRRTFRVKRPAGRYGRWCGWLSVGLPKADGSNA